MAKSAYQLKWGNHQQQNSHLSRHHAGATRRAARTIGATGYRSGSTAARRAPCRCASFCRTRRCGGARARAACSSRRWGRCSRAHTCLGWQESCRCERRASNKRHCRVGNKQQQRWRWRRAKQAPTHSSGGQRCRRCRRVSTVSGYSLGRHADIKARCTGVEAMSPPQR